MDKCDNPLCCSQENTCVMCGEEGHDATYHSTPTTLPTTPLLSPQASIPRKYDNSDGCPYCAAHDVYDLPDTDKTTAET